MSFVLPAEIVLASGNQGKLKELSELLSDCPNTLRLQSEFGVEPADEPACTFIENALLKARHAAARTGLAALADDSGLSVDALGGAPGVRSARYAGEPSDDARNRARLIEEGVREAACVRHAERLCAEDLRLEERHQRGVDRERSLHR